MTIFPLIRCQKGNDGTIAPTSFESERLWFARRLAYRKVQAFRLRKEEVPMDPMNYTPPVQPAPAPSPAYTTSCLKAAWEDVKATPNYISRLLCSASSCACRF